MMPLIAKEYSWRQTIDTVYVSLHVNGIRKHKTSFITAQDYIRLHCHPHYFEVFLWGGVDDLRGKCTLVEEESLVVFELPKVNLIDWPSLEVDPGSLSRPDKHSIRTRAVELSQKRAADEIAAGLERREANKQMTIREQLRLDEESRDRVACIRTFESQSAMNEFSECYDQEEKEEKSNKAGEDPWLEKNGSCQSSTFVEKGSRDPPSEEWNAKDLNGISEDPGNSSCKSGRNSSRGSKQKGDGKHIWSFTEIKQRQQDVLVPPPIRKEATISVAFTPRDFPTPSRESTAVEEEEWLRKQAEVRRTCGFQDEDLRPEERDPQWLYEKGESLMHAGSFVGAVSAFSTGIKLAPKMGQLYAGRARAHLALQNIRKAVEDASEGLEQLMPRVQQNAKERLQCYRVRAEAFCKLNMNQDALSDLQQAMRLDPENLDLKDLVKEITKAADEDYFKDSSDEEAGRN